MHTEYFYNVLAEVYPLITGLFVYLKDIGVTGGRAREFSKLNNHHTAFSMTQSISKILPDHKRFKTRRIRSANSFNNHNQNMCP